MKKKSLARILFFILFLALIIVLSIGYKKGKFAIVKPKDTKTFEPVETDKITLPVELSNSNVTTIYLAYNFLGPIKEVKSVDKGKQIVLDTTEKNHPDFIITDNDTKIFRVEANSNSNVIPATIGDLKIGLRISLSTTYDLKTRIWITRTVHIVD